MTKKQNALYWTEWSLAKKAGQLNEFDRHAIHEEALGEDKSHKDFSNEDLDKVLGAFRAISRPTSLNSQIRQIEQPETRLQKRIRDQVKCLALFMPRAEDYFQKLLRDRFHVDHLEDIAHCPSPIAHGGKSDLEMLRDTLADRIAPYRRDAGLSEHDMCARAGVPCFRKACAQCRDSNSPIAHRPSPIPESELTPFLT